MNDSDPYELLRELLAHMHIAELKETLLSLRLSPIGFNKQELIDRLVHFKRAGVELAPQEIPLISKGRSGHEVPIKPEAIMLYRVYKNDHATRGFFRKLIGQHFHFTAYGIDWLREQWIAGKPPTYAEFAHEWQSEYERNKIEKRPAKQEWAYIRFVQEYGLIHPEAKNSEINDAWKIWRTKAVVQARALLNSRLP
jgi:hypothetical protein